MFKKLFEWAFWLWALVGLGFGFGVTALGVFTVPASLLITILLLRRPRFRRSVYGVLVGIGAVLILIAYINRDGPFNARHWLLAGLALVAAGLIAQSLNTGRLGPSLRSRS